MGTGNLGGTTVAVTGADGFIGGYVVEVLMTQGAMVRRLCGPGAVGGSGVVIDLLDAEAVRRGIDGADLVVHLAARAGGVQFQERLRLNVLNENTTMTRNVLSAATDLGVSRVFIASSAVVYAKDAGPDISENANVVAPTREPVNPYAWSKLTDEVTASWIRGSGLEVVVGRFTNVFGRGASFDPGRSTVVHSLVKKAIDAAPQGVFQVWGDGTAVRSFIHVRDAARAVAAVLTSGADGEAYNMSAIGPVSVRELAEGVRELVDPTLEMRFDRSAPTGVLRRVLDVSKLRSLGFSPEIALDAGIQDVIEAYRAV